MFPNIMMGKEHWGGLDTIEDQHWELFEQAITLWYLPEDSMIQVTNKCKGTIQIGTLMDHIEDCMCQGCWDHLNTGR